MMERLVVAYQWFLAAHVIFMVFWMAGLFMLPRYLVYHQEALRAGNAAEAAVWVDRETKIRRIIITPAMLLVWALGLTLAFMALEIAGGLLTGSLALLADAGHMGTDAAGLALALLAIRFAARPATPRPRTATRPATRPASAPPPTRRCAP